MRVTIDELIQRYEIDKQAAGLSPLTIARVAANTRSFAKACDLTYMHEVTTNKVLGWGAANIDKNASKSTVYAYYNSLRSFLRYAESRGAVKRIEYDRIRCKPKYKERVCLRPADVSRIIRYAPDRQTKVLVRLIYTSGMRISEAISIAPDDLRGVEATLYIVGKGGKARPVFVTPAIMRSLRSLCREHGGVIFTQVSGEPMNRAAAYYRIKRAMTAAGFDRAHPHSLRHTFCTELLRQGVSLAHASRLMGHSSVSVTQVYTHLVLDDIQKEHAKLTRV